MKVFLNYTEIPNADIIQAPAYKSSLDSKGNLIASSGELTLNNAQGLYSDTNQLSQFFGSAFYNKPITIYDDIKQVYLFTGLIKNLIVDDTNKTVKVKYINYINELSKTTLVYSCSGKTGADAILDILAYAGVPDEFIQQSGFIKASSIQTTNSVLFNITYTAKDNVSCQIALNEILRITNCHLYTVNNVIHLYQWQRYNSESGYIIEKKHVISNSVITEYQDTVLNAYSIAYNNGGVVAYATGSALGTDGTKIFTAPNTDAKTTASAEVKIILTNGTGAAYCGALALQRFQYQAKIIKLKLKEDCNYLQCSDQIDLTYNDYTQEPITVTSVDYNTKTHTVEIAGVFRNLPVNIIQRDIEPPAKAVIESVLPYPTGACIRYSKNIEADYNKTQIYFTTTKGVWETEYCNQGISPIDSTNPVQTPDGTQCVSIYELLKNTRYYFKARSIDIYNNASTDSDVKQLLINASGTENYYRCKGDPYLGITLDEINSKGGSIPAGYQTYGSILYGSNTYQLASMYESYIYQAAQLTFKVTGKVKYVYRTSEDNITWSTWSTITSASPVTVINNTQKYLQVRFLFFPVLWSDPDKIYITEVI